MKRIFYFLTIVVVLISCNKKEVTMETSVYKAKVDKYFKYELNSDFSNLSENQKKMLPYLFEAADIMDNLYYKVACGDYINILDTLKDKYAIKYFKINYGPWDRLNGNEPFILGVGEKPAGAFFYPPNMTKEQFDALDDSTKTSQYSIIKYDENGKLVSVPYHIAFKKELDKAADLLRKAAEYAEDEGFKKYLLLRADALTTDKYFESDMAWMDMKDNKIDFVIGPIENYEDGLFGYKAAFEAYILIKDMQWSKKLSRYATLLPELQKRLPVSDIYKKETPGSNSQLNAYDAIYYAGDCNAGSKTIAINLPNDERVQLAKGSRRLQLKNAMKAKFDSIVVPISKILIDSSQQEYVTFDAFFANTMFHEVAHGLGVKHTIDGKTTCREALKERFSAYEEGKADILGLWLIRELQQMNEYQTDYLANQVTMIASIFRSIRFGSSSAHAKANLMRYNFFIEQGAISRSDDGVYSVNPDRMQQATDSLSRLILQIEGDGDYEYAGKIMKKYLVTPEYLKKDLQRLEDANIPVDVEWIQGYDVIKKNL